MQQHVDVGHDGLCACLLSSRDISNSRLCPFICPVIVRGAQITIILFEIVGYSVSALFQQKRCFRSSIHSVFSIVLMRAKTSLITR